METAPKINLPLSVFISYASVPKDEALLRELEAHLSLLKKLGLITTWHHKKTLAGNNVQQELSEHLETATLILLLVSADLLASEEYDNEIQTALERNKAGEALVIPILLRKVHMESTPLKHLQCLPRDGRPVSLWEDADEAFTTIVAEIRETIEKYPTHQDKRTSDKEKRLRLLVHDHHQGFLHDRLESFVGRQQELAEIQNLITQRLPTGGYITITGQAGQGKSSIIAKLIETYGVEKVAYHFIPINPGPDHQVGLLRNLMARLILKYDLSNLYVASDNRAALRDYFPKLLTDVANQGGQEIIFIDGLDQLEEDANGVRDLSFLPTNPPVGIVFVLGTRPNDTMKPLELLKPHNEYRLSNLSRQDFTLILEHRLVPLEKHLADQLYQTMEENALYLDLVARELMARDAIDPLAMISRVAANPANVFTLSFERLQRQESLWERVIYPVLGVLLVAQEPLPSSCIKDILQIEQYKLKDGLTKLGGLLTQDHQQRYSLFHLKLRDYLRQSVGIPQNDALFPTEEEEQWHGRLAQWCERGDLSQIWQDVKDIKEQQRRKYARQHYITHLYYAHKWQQLFDVLDEGSYGHAKERYDVSTRSYVQDLDRGRQAVVLSDTPLEETIARLPYLWRYTLLRGSLRSHADQYPRETFQLLLLLEREQEVLGLAELLTDMLRKVETLLLVAEYLAQQPAREMECEQIYFRAFEVCSKIEGSDERAEALSGLARSLVEVGQWEQAEEVARGIGESDERAEALSGLARSLAEAGQWGRAEPIWKEAEEIARAIEGSDRRARALSGLARSLAKAGPWEKAEEVARGIEARDWRARALSGLVSSLAEAGQWKEAEGVARTIEVNDRRVKALSGLVSSLAEAGQWGRAEGVARGIEESYWRAKALSGLASSLAKAGQWERAESIWKKAEEVVRIIEESDGRAKVLSGLASSLAKAGQWERAEGVARGIEESEERVEALSELASSLAKAGQRERAEPIWKEAEEVARAIEESDGRVEVLSELASSLAKVRQKERSMMICAEVERAIRLFIGESDGRAKALSGLASSLAKAGQWERAEEVARGIEESEERAAVLSELASSLDKVRQWERAKPVWKEAEEVARAIEKSEERAAVLSGLASSLAKAGQWERAKGVAQGIEESEERAEALSELASSLAEAGQWERAERVARGIEESYWRAKALSELALLLAKAGQWERAEGVARGIGGSNWRVEALSGLVSSLAKAGQWERAEGVARGIEESEEQAKALSELASSLAEAGQWERAEGVARGIGGSNWRVEALSGLASSLAKAGQWERAEPIWKEAEGVARAIEKSEERVEALSELASSLAEAGQWERAEPIWKEAEGVARAIEESEERVEALSELASSLAEAGQWERAEGVSRTIEDNYVREELLSVLANTLLISHEYQRLISLIHTSWLRVETRDDAFLFFPLALRLLPLQPEIGEAFYRGFQWVDAFLKR